MQQPTLAKRVTDAARKASGLAGRAARGLVNVFSGEFMAEILRTEDGVPNEVTPPYEVHRRADLVASLEAAAAKAGEPVQYCLHCMHGDAGGVTELEHHFTEFRNGDEWFVVEWVAETPQGNAGRNGPIVAMLRMAMNSTSDTRRWVNSAANLMKLNTDFDVKKFIKATGALVYARQYREDKQTYSSCLSRYLKAKAARDFEFQSVSYHPIRHSCQHLTGYICTGKWCSAQSSQMLSRLQAYRQPNDNWVRELAANQAALLSMLLQSLASFVVAAAASTHVADPLSARKYTLSITYSPTGLVDVGRALNDDAVQKALVAALTDNSTLHVTRVLPGGANAATVPRLGASCLLYVWATAVYMNDQLPAEPPEHPPITGDVRLALSMFNMVPHELTLFKLPAA